ncbi:MAG: IS1595 family transposase, partial [Bacteroidota bacterium]
YVSQDYLHFYLDEFAFRYNRRNSKSRGLLFYTLLKQAMSHQPLSKKICLKVNKIKGLL